MAKNIKCISTPSLWLLSLTLLGLAAWAGYEAQQALPGLAHMAGAGPSAEQQSAALGALKLNPQMANALPMVAVGAAATLLLLLALGAALWRRRSGVSAAHGVAVDAPGAAEPAATDSVRPDAKDVLAGLFNRDQFLTHHESAVAEAAQHKERVAVLCFDLERLSSINAMLGFEAGDEAIALTAQRARASLGSAGALARLGGGTFAALVRMEGSQTVVQRAQAFRVALQQSVHWREQELDLGVTVGGAISPEHGETTVELLRRAEQALFEAKRLGTVAAAYHPAIEAARLSHLEMARSLNEALDRDELVPYLLPRWCTSSQRVVSAEVLVRWQHPARGLLLPAEFLPFAQAHGRMARITQHMLQSTVKLLKHELPTHQLSVNLSATDLREPGLVPMLQQLLLAQGIAAHRLCLEVAEKALLAGGTEALARLAELRQLGVGVAIDDFGTGAAPLAQLRHLPASELKLDNSCIMDVNSNPGRQQLLQTVIDMAHNLNLTVTAKGVETPGEREVLERLGCDFLQGYLIGRPVPVQAFVGASPVQTPAQAQAEAQSQAT